MSWSLIREFCP